MPEERQTVSIIPEPQSIEPGEGELQINRATKILIDAEDPDVWQVAEYFAGQLKQLFGLTLSVGFTTDEQTEASIRFRKRFDRKDLGDEGYQLTVDSLGVRILAPTTAGLFYGAQSLLQLFPPVERPEFEWIIPAVTIEDRPRYPWRGMHLDVCRHFFTIAEVKKYIDLLAIHKMNRFHWHLTEDQGWRIEIKQYPRLTDVGAWRTDNEGRRYGGYYTQEGIREVVEYARRRFITVVPEIEMPGHALAALAAYPEYSCTGGPFKVATEWGVFDDVFCAGNDSTFIFLQNILDEVIALFPGPYIHIGGDECPKIRWEQCQRCQQRMADENLKDEHELQSYFIRRIEEYLNSQGKRIIGWDEILEGGLPPRATVMSWRGMEGGIAAARSGHNVIMSPTSHCYFDYYQAQEGEPKAIGGFLPLEKVYSFDPTPPDLSDQEVSHILGGQGNVWTEYMPDFKQVEYMAVPRLCAIAEVLWSCKSQQNYKHFMRRLRAHYLRMNRMDINYRYTE